MTDLYQRSIEIILANQHPSGAYIASPNFAPYRYCWIRDGSFLAYAMDLVGEHSSAARYHSWAAKVVNQREEVVRRAIEINGLGKPLAESDILHTRYTLEGKEAEEGWHNFQLDGYGTWLWALGEHRRLSGRSFFKEYVHTIDLVADYLSALWRSPCYDCWEEFPDKIHTYTLAAVCAGLHACSSYGNMDHTDTVQTIRDFIHAHNVAEGHYVKYMGSDEVDASLIGLSVPYRVATVSDALIYKTVDRIETDLRQNGGVHRYPGDTYYGGGEWILLTAWLGWHYAEIGEPERAVPLLKWIEKQADENGNLPEQVPNNLNNRSYLEPWCNRWGNIAQPLLWSHANYLILHTALDQSGP